MLLVGPTSYKTTLVDTWCEITGSNPTKMFLTPETEASQLLGEIQPFSFKDLCRHLIKCAHSLNKQLRVLTALADSLAIVPSPLRYRPNCGDMLQELRTVFLLCWLQFM